MFVKEVVKGGGARLWITEQKDIEKRRIVNKGCYVLHGGYGEAGREGRKEGGRKRMRENVKRK